MIKFLILFFLFIFPFVPQAFADCNQSIAGDCPAGLKEIEGIFTNVISIFVGLAFVALLVMLVTAGIKYITSAGEPKAIQAAHQTVAWAFLGIIFMAVAWLILQLIQSFTGIQVTLFDIRPLCNVAGKNFCP